MVVFLQRAGGGRERNVKWHKEGPLELILRQYVKVGS